MSISSLLKLVPPPATPKNPGSLPEWEKLTAKLGMALPQDYLEMCNAYGTGYFVSKGAGPIYVFNVFEPRAFRQLQQFRKATALCREFSPGVIRDDEYVLNWAADTVSVNFSILLSEKSRQSQLLLHNREMDAYRRYRMKMTDLLGRLFMGKLKTDFFKSSDFDGGVTFQQRL